MSRELCLVGEIIKNTCWREGNIIVWLRVE